MTTKWTCFFKCCEWDMKQLWSTTPFIWEADKGYIPVKRSLGALHIEAKRCSSSSSSSSERQQQLGLKKKKKKKISFWNCWCHERRVEGAGVVLGHLLDELKHWKSARRADQKHWQRTRKHVCVRVRLRLLLENAWVRYLCLDTESTISRLNFGEGVRCLRVTLGHSARAQRNTQRGALETGPCLEHNRTAAMATSGRCDKQTR